MDTSGRQERTEPRTVGLDAHPDSFTAALMAGQIPLEAEVLKVSDKLSLPTLEAWLAKNPAAAADTCQITCGVAILYSESIYDRICCLASVEIESARANHILTINDAVLRATN